MAERGTELRYEQQEVRFAGKYLFVEEIKVTIKQENEELIATRQMQPYAMIMGKNSYEIQLNGIDVEHLPWIQKYKDTQDGIQGIQNNLIEALPGCHIFDYNPKNHVMRLVHNFMGCIIEEISQDSAAQFDVKIKALNRKPNKDWVQK